MSGKKHPFGLLGILRDLEASVGRVANRANNDCIKAYRILTDPESTQEEKDRVPELLAKAIDAINSLTGDQFIP